MIGTHQSPKICNLVYRTQREEQWRSVFVLADLTWEQWLQPSQRQVMLHIPQGKKIDF